MDFWKWCAEHARAIEIAVGAATAIGTLVLATVAVFQDTIRQLFYKPKFRIAIRCEPPDCVWVPFTNLQTGAFIAHSVYLRLWIENTGNAPARNVEVYAKELRLHRADGTWERVREFPPMNLLWANPPGTVYWPVIVSEMGKHCDLAHIVDPALRAQRGEENPALGLPPDRTSLAFDLMAAPNHKGHIVGPGRYQLDIVVAAENSRPLTETVEINLEGPWYADETRMLRDGVGVRIVRIA